jgi:hypothetical protein
MIGCIHKELQASRRPKDIRTVNNYNLGYIKRRRRPEAANWSRPPGPPLMHWRVDQEEGAIPQVQLGVGDATLSD